MASQPAPAVNPDPEIYNERSQRRTAALQQLKTILTTIRGRDTVPAPFWAFCQVAEISKLEVLTENLTQLLSTHFSDPILMRSFVDLSIDNCEQVILRC
jgi:hypothetical protein